MRFVFRILAVLFVFALVAVILNAASFHGGHGPGPGGPPAAVRGFVTFVLVMVLLSVVFATFSARRLSRPLGDLVRAARRVEAGDYTARVSEPPWGPPTLRDLMRTFNTMSARLQADEEQRRRLLADTSHELRTPLTVLQGELEAMLDGVHARDEAHLGLALDQTRQMARLIDDLRTLALAEAGTLQLHRESTDLVALAHDAASAFGALASRDNLRIEVVAPAAVILDVDPVRLRQVLDNLLSNALRYAPPSTAVTVELLADDGAAHLAVSDHGPGIPAALLSTLFERFHKSDESKGSGLGLAIARELVEAHGGMIRAVSEAGQGTRIEVTLPRLAASD